METPTITIWTPNLKQDNPNNINNPGDVYFENTDVNGNPFRYNIYALNYATTFKLLPGTFTIPSTEPGAGRRDTDIPASVYEKRQTLIGVIPLINLTSNNRHPDYPIRFSFPANNFAVSVEQLDRDYYVIPQASSDQANVENEGGLYKHPGADDVRLPYRNMLLINGVYDASGAFRYGQNSITVRMEMKQAATPAHFDPSYNEKKILVPLTISKSDTAISLRTFTGVGSNKNNSIPNVSGEIVREWLDGGVDLNFADFAQTNRVNIQTGEPDYGDIEYYISLTGERTFVRVDNDKYIQISGNRITFLKSTETVPPTSPAVSIPIRILQEETPVYNRSNRIETETATIRIIIKKSIPTFVNQIPDENTDEPTTIYRLPDLNKMTTEGSFRLVPPESTNREPAGIISFSSSNESLLKIRVSVDSSLNTIYTAVIYGSGTAIITVTQAATDNFHQKVATFAVNIFEITPAIINCNTNLFYTNPYNRQFWTRFKPECRSSNMVDSVSRQPLTVSQVDEVYDMRRKAEILKYNKNVGGLTKNQKYAKASRGELMRNIGNSTRYISDPASPFALICPPTAANSRLLCGLTTACGVPGRERVLCYDPSVNLYNYKRTYQYEAGLQATINIPTTILTEPKNFRVTNYDNVNKRVTLMWDAPDSNGGLPITGYVITYSVNNKTWAPYKSVFPYKPVAGGDASFNEVSGEINGNSVIFERIPGSIEILDNTVYYLSVFSGNERGLSSVPATLTLKTSSVPSIINDFGFTNSADERQNLMVDLKWTEPTNTGSVDGGISGYNGPPVNMYHLYYRKVPDTTWIKKTIDLSNVIIPTVGSLSRRYVLRNIENESKYQIKIEPINSVGVGPESAIITARTLMAPGTPLNIVLSPKFALLPPIYTDSSGNYINITWNKPDTGGSIIKYYNITITPPPSSSLGSVVTYPYNIASNDTQSSYSANIGLLNNNVLVSGSYSVVMETNNGYLPSVQSAVAFVTIDPLSAKPSIFNIEGYYVSSGLVYAELTFSIATATQPENTITNVIVNGFTGAYQTTRNSDNQEIAGTGEHKFRIPASSSGIEIIIVGTQYFITITLVYQNGEKQTSEVFSYTPDIRYLNV
jgi:hypothetical protein